MHKRPTKPVRVPPDRKWFGNVRTISAKDLEKTRVEMLQAEKNPYKMLLKARKLPESLLKKPDHEEATFRLLDVEKYEQTFGPKAQRKRPKLNDSSLDTFVSQAEEKASTYSVEKDTSLRKAFHVHEAQENRDMRLNAGQSKRIWDELYKVLDASDVLCMILDARNPQGTRCLHVEEHIKRNHPNKHVVMLLNKCDLVPTSVSAAWVKYLSQYYPTVAYHASISNPFGKSALIQILRQFDNFHKDKKNISVGLIGYPNVGKSSVINSLKKKKCCKAAPVPGETKVWQYVTLTKRIYLIDCPGIVYNSENDDDIDIVLKGVVRAEKLIEPDLFVEHLIKKVEKKVMNSVYGLDDDWESGEDFLNKLATSMGRLLRVTQTF